MKHLLILLYTTLPLLAFSQSPTKKNTHPAKDTVAIAHNVQPLLKEVSGIADSKLNPGFLWAHEDSGQPPHLYLLDRDGAVRRTIPMKDVYNRDWEDMALSKGYIYIGNIGDNRQQYSQYQIFRFEEPKTTTDTIREVQTIRFRYPDGSHDAEAFIVDPSLGDITVITKRDSISLLYKITAPFTTDTIITMEQVGQLPYNGVVSAAISPDGTKILVKTYMQLWMYVRKKNMSVAQALLGKPIRMPYRLEPQGEAVSFALDGSGYFTLSEQGFWKSVSLWYYRW